MNLNESALLDALKTSSTEYGKDLVGQATQNLQIEGGDASFDVELGDPAKSQMPPRRRALVAAARTAPGVDNVSADESEDRVARGAARRGADCHVNNIVAVASAKGGVGKSPPPPTWRWRWSKAPVSASSTPTSTA